MADGRSKDRDKKCEIRIDEVRIVKPEKEYRWRQKGRNVCEPRWGTEKSGRSKGGWVLLVG